MTTRELTAEDIEKYGKKFISMKYDDDTRSAVDLKVARDRDPYCELSTNEEFILKAYNDFKAELKATTAKLKKAHNNKAKIKDVYKIEITHQIHDIIQPPPLITVNEDGRVDNDR